MWLDGIESLTTESSTSHFKQRLTSKSGKIGDSFLGSSATTILAAAAARLASGAGATSASLVSGGLQQQVAVSQPPTPKVSAARDHPDWRLSPIARSESSRREQPHEPCASKGSSNSDSSQQQKQQLAQQTNPSNVQQQQQHQQQRQSNMSSNATAPSSSSSSGARQDRPERISFYLKTSIFTRRVTIDRDKLALGSVKQLAIAFLNELYFQHTYPPGTYLGDYIREHYSNTDNLSHLYERLILRKYCCDAQQERFVPFNSVCDIEPESFISIEVGERTTASRHHQQQHLLNKPTTTLPATPVTTTTTTPFTHNTNSASQLSAATGAANKVSNEPANPTSSTTTLIVGGGTSSNANINSSSLSSSPSSSSAGASSALVAATNLIRMTHDFKQESYFKPTYCAFCSHLIKGIIYQGYQCKNCKKNYCSECKTRAESPGSSDSCLVPVNSGNLLIGAVSAANSSSTLSNLFFPSRNNNNNNFNSIDNAANNNNNNGANSHSGATNNPGSPSMSSSENNKLEVSHTNMSKRKSASNLLQHLNLANPFKTHHNIRQQTSKESDNKSNKTRGSSGALEPVLHQLSKQREQEQRQNLQNLPTSNESSGSGSASGSGGDCNTLSVAQSKQLSSSHQNLFVNGKLDANGKRIEGKQGGAGDEDDERVGLKKLSNSARTSTTDLHAAAATANETSGSKRDQANHSFALVDLASLKPTIEDKCCDVCSKSLKNSAQHQQPLICKSCKLCVHSNCQNLILIDCLSRIAESSRAAAAAAAAADEDSLNLSNDPTSAREGIRSSSSNISRDNIRLHRLARSVRHVKRPDSAKLILEGWLRHTTLSDEHAHKHYWRLDETDLTLYDDDESTRYFKAIALSEITCVMSSHSLPKQIREDVLLTNATINTQPQSSASDQRLDNNRAKSATTSPIKTPELQTQMKAMFAFKLASGSMYLVQAENELEASKWREHLELVIGKTTNHSASDKQPQSQQQQQAAIPSSGASPVRKVDQQMPPASGAVDKLVESVNQFDLQKDQIVQPPTSTTTQVSSSKDQPVSEGSAEDKTNNNLVSPSSAATQEKKTRQPTVQRQHHHRYPPSGHRRANFLDPNRSRLYNRQRKEIRLSNMDIIDHLICGKYLVEKDYTKGGKVELGSGQFGKVYAAISDYKLVDADKGIWSGVPVAIKEISKKRFDLMQQAKLKNEANILSGLDHPGVIILERLHDLPSEIYIVMEQLDDDMLEMIVSTPEKRLNERVTKFLTYQILEALKYLHAQKIAHCDLKPENVLLVDKHTYPQIKLCDFGFAKIIEENSFRQSLVGTPAYLAPEVIQKKQYNRSVDLWSVGVIVYVSLSGEFPFNDGEDIHKQISLANFMYPKQIWGDISEQAKKFINSLLRVDSGKRLSANNAQNDIWLQEDFQLWCDLCDLEFRVGRRWVTDDADYERWSQYARDKGCRIPSSAVQLHESLNAD